MSERLRIAITKGRLLDKSMDLFDQMGLNTAPVRDPGRRLIHEIPNYPLDAVLSKAPDGIMRNTTRRPQASKSSWSTARKR